MKLFRTTLVAATLVAVAMLSGCVLVPVDSGYYPGSSGHYGSHRHYEDRGGYGYR